MDHNNRCNVDDTSHSTFRPAAALVALVALAGCSGSGRNESTAIGGALNVGGSADAVVTGGANSVGGNGATPTGGATAAASGGVTAAASGGTTQGKGTGGQPYGTGGSTGKIATGGVPATGGSATAGGVSATGGRTAGGGVPTTGGVPAGGGKSATGGSATAGGKSATGGTDSAAGSAAGGSTAAGGSGVVTDSLENTGANCVGTAAPLLSAQSHFLPDPFAMHDGTRIATKAQWECRRNEIKKDLEKYEIGTKPEPPTVAATYSGGKLNVVVTTSSGSITLTSTVTGTGSCVVIGMNSSTSLVSGCTQVPFAHDQVVKYGSDSTQYQTDPFYKVYPSLWGKVGNYTAWSWGISRIIDGLEQVKSQMNIDTKKIATWGCSYAGKMSLFGAALDERVALGIVEESGGGGINAWRTTQDFSTRTGTSVEKIDNTNYSWFLSSMKSLDPYKLPHDHHELIAMMAPRATIILGNDDYDWLGDESGYRSTMAAIEVFKALGVADHIGYDFTSGHSHCAAPATQVASVKTFVDRFLKDGTGSPNVAIKPPKTSFDLNYASVVNWTTPTLQ
jgi:hypothetical protein